MSGKVRFEFGDETALKVLGLASKRLDDGNTIAILDIDEVALAARERLVEMQPRIQSQEDLLLAQQLGSKSLAGMSAAVEGSPDHKRLKEQVRFYGTVSGAYYSGEAALPPEKLLLEEVAEAFKSIGAQPVQHALEDGDAFDSALAAAGLRLSVPAAPTSR